MKGTVRRPYRKLRRRSRWALMLGNIEAGTKWDLASNVQFTAAVFEIEKTNAKTTDLNGATVLAGDQRVRGVEFGLSGNITPRWGAFGGLSLMNGEVVSSGIATEVGAQLPYVPKASLNLWTTYRLPSGLMRRSSSARSKQTSASSIPYRSVPFISAMPCFIRTDACASTAGASDGSSGSESSVI